MQKFPMWAVGGEETAEKRSWCRGDGMATPWLSAQVFTLCCGWMLGIQAGVLNRGEANQCLPPVNGPGTPVSLRFETWMPGGGESSSPLRLQS